MSGHECKRTLSYISSFVLEAKQKNLQRLRRLENRKNEMFIYSGNVSSAPSTQWDLQAVSLHH